MNSDAQNINCPVGIDQEASMLLDAFDELADSEINNPDADDSCKQLWNRAHLKALKLAALIAVGVNYRNPVIRKDHAEYAIKIIKADIAMMLGNFDAGLMAGDEVRREHLVLEASRAYLAMDYNKRLTYIKSTALAKLDVVPIAFLRRRLRNVSDFAYAGDTGRALDNAIKSLVDMGDLIPVGQPELIKEGVKTRTEAYQLVTKYT